MSKARIQVLREEVDRLNLKILEAIQERARIVEEIGRLKRESGARGHDPKREQEMLERLTADPKGPFGPEEIRDIFKAIFRASLDIQEPKPGALRVLSHDLLPPGGLRVGRARIGGPSPVIVAGPCSVESPEQMEEVAAHLARYEAVPLLRAGAFKPRTSPYSFQGLREDGLALLSEAGRRHGLATVTEVLDVSCLDVVAEHCDVLQIGARNMYNTELLKAVGRMDKPVLLKRGFMATLEELMLSAEYILSGGNTAVILCERGIRTFETSTRNTLDVSAIPLLKAQTSLPVLVDVSHALGRRDFDVMLPCARAALAAGADGLMVEVHDRPDQALSDSFQQIDLATFTALLEGLGLAEERAVLHPAPSPADSDEERPRRPAVHRN